MPADQQPNHHCPRCGEPTERLCEGYCEPCCEQGQHELDMHNAQSATWDAMTDRERAAAIRWASR